MAVFLPYHNPLFLSIIPEKEAVHNLFSHAFFAAFPQILLDLHAALMVCYKKRVYEKILSQEA